MRNSPDQPLPPPPPQHPPCSTSGNRRPLRSRSIATVNPEGHVGQGDNGNSNSVATGAGARDNRRVSILPAQSQVERTRDSALVRAYLVQAARLRDAEQARERHREAREYQQTVVQDIARGLQRDITNEVRRVVGTVATEIQNQQSQQSQAEVFATRLAEQNVFHERAVIAMTGEDGYGHKRSSQSGLCEKCFSYKPEEICQTCALCKSTCCQCNGSSNGNSNINNKSLE
ncbi:hypothetical protein BGZ58_010215, partial [Dissophora ornata]